MGYDEQLHLNTGDGSRNKPEFPLTLWFDSAKEAQDLKAILSLQ
jgi:hypothetical protein